MSEIHFDRAAPSEVASGQLSDARATAAAANTSSAQPKRKARGLLRRLRQSLMESWLFYALVRVAVWIVAHLPLRLARAFGADVGRTVFHLQRARRPLCLANLSFAFPDKSRTEQLAILKACYTHLGLCGADFCRFTRLEKENLLNKLIVPDADAFEVTRAAFAEGHGVIAVASHIGFWELSGFASNVLGFEKIVSVSRKIPIPRLEEYLTRVRERLGNQMVNQEGALRPILRALRENRSAGILTDLHAGRGYPWIPFFGKEASTFDTCAKLHLKTGAPLLRVLMLRRSDGRYRWSVKRIDPGTLSGSENDQVRQVLIAINRSLEQAIRENPEQWLWMNKRWREKK
jgi:KDO2-lipid IV(A) lauroyltransferase